MRGAEVAMRTEYEVLELIKSIAKDDSRIKAVALCGSRADENCPKDIYQDYDAEYYVEDIKPFWDNMKWFEDSFGKTILYQLPEVVDGIKDGDRFAYLAIFEDGVRIDLSILKLPQRTPQDGSEPKIVLLDKCGLFDGVRFNQWCHNVSAPDQKEFAACCNEFWWCLNNVAKGLAREQIPYVKNMYDINVRPMLDKMLSWYIGSITDFSVSSGKYGKYFKKYLPDSIYSKYLRAYCLSDPMRIWTSVISTCKLFSDVAKLVASELGLKYNQSEEDGSRIYMMNVKNGVYSL